jgi:hypothetical protein
MGNNIRETIKKQLNEFNLTNKITTAITDNGSNMVKAIREWGGVERIPCSAHTLQLCVIKGMKKATDYIDRFKKLNLFFSSPKQNEKLEEAQAELAEKFRNQHELPDQLSDENDQAEEQEKSQLHILRTITEVPTRWGSALASWRRLRELKPAIKRVLVNLSTETDISSKKDYRQLQERMLKAYEWNLLDKLIELFEPIEDATEFLGGQKYCTLSLIYPTIQALKYSYADNSNNENGGNGDGGNGNGGNEDGSNDDEDDDSDDKESGSENGMSFFKFINIIYIDFELLIIHKKQNPIDFADSMDEDHQPNLKDTVNLIKEEIYNALYYYFDNPPNATILASLLDPRSKQMNGWPEELKEKTISLLQSEYKKEKQKEPSKETNTNTNSQPKHQCKSFATRVFGLPQSQTPIYEEFSYYLDEIKTPQAVPEVDPFEWWRDNQKKFPILYKIARKYLGIPATSVPSERLFSDAGNQISTERNRLKPSTVNDLLFVKRNIKYINPFV